MTTRKNEPDHAISALSSDGIDRRGFLSCMAWAGAGLVWTFSGGIASSRLFAATSDQTGGNTASHPADFANSAQSVPLVRDQNGSEE